jgi:IPT/TIG domain-containing protein
MTRHSPHSVDGARFLRIAIIVLVVAGLAALFVITLMPATAQTNSRITSVDPTTGKANDSVTANGEALAKGTVSGIFLSDDQNDHKATIVDQEADKIVFKIPDVKAGGYNVSIQVGNSLLIQPVRFTVQ